MHIPYNAYFNIITIIVFVSLLFRYKKNICSYNLPPFPRLNRQDLLSITAFLIILTTVNWQFLGLSLVSDEIYHAMTTNYFSMKIARKFLEVPTLNMLRMVNLMGLFFLFLCAALFKMPRYRILSIGILLLYFHNFTWLVNEPHPPLRLFLPWMFSSILGMTNFSFQVTQQVILTSIAFLVFKKTYSKIGVVQAFLLGLTTASLPLILHTGTLFEFSIWTVFISLWIFLIFYDDLDNQIDILSFFKASWLIALGALIRQPIFLLSIPLISYYWYNFSKKNIRNEYGWSFFMIFSPLGIMLPFISKSIILGTPATYRPEEQIPFIMSYLSGWERLYFAFKKGIVVELALKNVGIISLIISCFAFMPISKKEITFRLWILLTFVCLFIPFYLIRPIYWGIGRYHAETFGSFYAIGLVTIILLINKLNSLKMMSFTIMIGIFGWNLYDYNTVFQQSFNYNEAVVTERYPKVISKGYYPWDDALKTAHQAGHGDSLYTIGSLYGIFPLILNGFSAAELKKAKKLYDYHNSHFDFDQMTSDSNLNLILIADKEVEKKADYVEELKQRGWKFWKRFPGKYLNDDIIGLVKPAKE